MKSTGRMARISSNLIILAILVVLNIIAVVFAFSATDLAWNAREQAQKKNIATYRAGMEELIEAKEYQKLYSYYSSNHITGIDELSDYSIICRASRVLPGYIRDSLRAEESGVRGHLQYAERSRRL